MDLKTVATNVIEINEELRLCRLKRCIKDLQLRMKEINEMSPYWRTVLYGRTNVEDVLSRLQRELDHMLEELYGDYDNAA